MSKFTIITENDVSKWDDKKGVRYHFPKRYLKFLSPDTRIIYYKGKIRNKTFESERLSNDPHYFGIGVIGEVRQESKKPSNYFAEILDYIEFEDPVSFKDSNGRYRESIPDSRKSNYWRDGVRPTDESFYRLITSLAGLSDDLPLTSKVKEYPMPNVPNPEFTEEELLEWYERKNMLVRDSSSQSIYSNKAKEIGDRGEKIVFNYLEKLESKGKVKKVVWHAKIGETPGYDISYINAEGHQICIEVKSTSGRRFMKFIMTSNEVESARKIGENYKVYLVVDCLSNKPRIQIIDNPTSDSAFSFDAMSYKVYKSKI